MILLCEPPISVLGPKTYRSAKIKQVIRAVQVFRPWSSVISTLYEQSVLPRVIAVATAVTTPVVADR